MCHVTDDAFFFFFASPFLFLSRFNTTFRATASRFFLVLLFFFSFKIFFFIISIHSSARSVREIEWLGLGMKRKATARHGDDVESGGRQPPGIPAPHMPELCLVSAIFIQFICTIIALMGWDRAGIGPLCTLCEPPYAIRYTRLIAVGSTARYR
ncbi:uncharacterized protein B0T23DRAFT_104485 [Neurospora hispaniola]|uniref:Uncharacterized protein n=1 Tax=Neurospora hispaniola TaxID=588809 RepID=A0AAJ0I953_9PEZI|nr:hypothetical protein B0T23DRAFT_104485 [Neurospora hispaniola]